MKELILISLRGLSPSRHFFLPVNFLAHGVGVTFFLKMGSDQNQIQWHRVNFLNVKSRVSWVLFFGGIHHWKLLRKSAVSFVFKKRQD